jgi:hypothetical protein
MNKISKGSLPRKAQTASSKKYQRKPWVIWLVLFLIVGGIVYAVYNRISDNRQNNLGLESDASGQNLDLMPITAQLLNKAHEYKKAPAEVKQVLEEELVILAMERRELMLGALEKNPKAVARAAIPAGLAKQLPSEVSRFIETEATVSGTVDVVNTYYEDKTETNEYTLVDSRGKNYRIRAEASSLGKVTGGSKIRISGVTLNDNIVPKDESSIVMTSQATAATINKRKVAVILVNFQNDTTTHETHDSIRTKIFTDQYSPNKYFQAVSYGKLELVGHLRPDGDIFGYYTIPYDKLCSDTSVVQQRTTAAKNMAAADGFNSANYHNTIFLWSGGCGGVGGQGFWNTGELWTGSIPLYIPSFTLNHELGHTLGWTHSGSVKCTDNTGASVAISTTCTLNQYGDPHEIMGGSGKITHPNNHKKGLATQIGNTQWIASSNVLTLASGQSGTFTIVPMEQATTGIQTLRIPKSFAPQGGTPYNGYFYLEFRQNPIVGPWSSYPAGSLDGVLIRFAQGFDTSNLSYIFDASPEDTTWSDFALKVGKTFTDPQTGISITTNSVSPAGVVVSVSQVSVPCTRANLSLLGGSGISTYAGYTYTFSYILKNNDSVGCAPATFSISPSNMPSGWFMTPSSITETLVPGASVTRSASITTSASTQTGNYLVPVTARDIADSSRQSYINFDFSITNTTTPPPTTDTTLPTVSITSPTAGSVLKARSTVNITANAADNVAVTKVEFVVGGKVICTDSSPAYSCSWEVPSGKKSHTILVRAYDAAGNIGYSSVAVTSR